MADKTIQISNFAGVSAFKYSSHLTNRSWVLSVGAICILFLSLTASGQQTESPVVIQPGAPGQSSRKLPPTTRAVLPPVSIKDTEFMQGMIMHHAQAVEMVALMASRTENRELLLLGSRISQSQSDEMGFMTRWLQSRGSPLTVPMDGMNSMDMPGMDHSMDHSMMMPGMLSKRQMAELKKAKNDEFDRLFLAGMIQHHTGALLMVREMFDTAGAGQDAELFNFATDVDSGQRAEIKIMQKMLGKNN